MSRHLVACTLAVLGNAASHIDIIPWFITLVKFVGGIIERIQRI